MLNTFYLLVAGPRVYNKYNEFSGAMDFVCKRILNYAKRLVIVEGGALGVDGMARSYAIEHNYAYVEMRADWTKYGKSAGIRRNKQMHDYIHTKCVECAGSVACSVLLFWNGTSRGTASNIEIAESLNNPVCIVFVETDKNSGIKITENSSEAEKNYIHIDGLYRNYRLENFIDKICMDTVALDKSISLLP